MRYVFSDKVTKSNGKEIWATCKKISGVSAFLSEDNPEGDPYFLITVSEPIWDVLPQDKRVPLVDHELCHIWAEAKQQENDGDSDEDMEIDNPVVLSNRPHDLEEFTCIARRYGFWREGMEDFVEAALKRQKEPSE